MAVETDKAALERNFAAALERYRGTILTFARSCVYQLPGMDLDDISQELTMKLWQCVQRYDPDRGASFNTLFQGTARNHVITMIRAADVKMRGKGVITKLDPEAFSRAAESMRADGSAEDWYLAIVEHAEKFAAESAMAS